MRILDDVVELKCPYCKHTLKTIVQTYDAVTGDYIIGFDTSKTKYGDWKKKPKKLGKAV